MSPTRCTESEHLNERKAGISDILVNIFLKEAHDRVKNLLFVLKLLLDKSWFHDFEGFSDNI